MSTCDEAKASRILWYISSELEGISAWVWQRRKTFRFKGCTNHSKFAERLLDHQCDKASQYESKAHNREFPE